jgi:hypothetical protein
LTAQSIIWNPAFGETGPPLDILAHYQVASDDGYVGVELLFPTPSTTFPKNLLYLASVRKGLDVGNIQILEWVPPSSGTAGALNEFLSWDTETAIRGMAFSPDENYFVVGTKDVIVYKRVADDAKRVEIARTASDLPWSCFAWLGAR